MKVKAKLLSPLLLIAMLFSLMAGAIMAVPQVATQVVASASGDGGSYSYYFEVSYGYLYLTPSSAHTGYVDYDSYLYGYNNDIPGGVYCFEFDFDKVVSFGDEILECTGHFQGTADFPSANSGGNVYLDGEVTVNYPGVVLDETLYIGEGRITLYDAPTSGIVPGECHSYLEDSGAEIVFTDGALTKCPALDVYAEYEGPGSGTQVGDTFKIWIEVDNYHVNRLDIILLQLSHMGIKIALCQ